MNLPPLHRLKAIIWDWNGTLLDDAVVCVQIINHSLAKRDLPLLDVKTYREIFTFPVINYYERAGFDLGKYPFADLAVEFMDRYRVDIMKAPLHDGIREVLDYFRNRGIMQVILSAMEQGLLEEMIDHHGLRHYFTHIRGALNDLAYGKEESARILFNALNLSPTELCMIGDTLHDLEVAEELGISCLIALRGHQSPERFRHHTHQRFRHPSEILEIFGEKNK